MEHELQKKKTKFKVHMPDTAAFFMIMIVFTAILTMIIPSGTFDRMVDEVTGRTIVVDGTFQWIDSDPVTFSQVLSSVFRGLIDGADIVAFIFIVGGCFGIINATGAFESGLDALIRKFHGREGVMIAGIMIALGVCGGTFGMGEEALPFVAILVAATRKMKMGRITGVAIVVIGIYSGYTAGPLNPFNTGIGQEIAELPTFSGLGLRVLLMVGAMAIGIHHVVSTGKKIKEGKLGYLTLNDDNVDFEEINKEVAPLDNRQKIVLGIMGASILIMIFCVLKFGWYFEEISVLFVAMGLVAGLFYFRSLDETGKAFVKGSCEMTTAVIYFGFARAILIVMQDGAIMDTIVYAMSIPLKSVNGIFAAWGIFLSQGIVNFFIPSSSGQAAAVMPILTPLADLIGVSRQTAVMAYQCGDGFWNMITPTQMVVLAACGLGGVKFTDWFKYSWKLVIKWCIWTFIVLSIAVATNYGPF